MTLSYCLLIVLIVAIFFCGCLSKADLWLCTGYACCYVPYHLRVKNVSPESLSCLLLFVDIVNKDVVMVYVLS